MRRKRLALAVIIVAVIVVVLGIGFVFLNSPPVAFGSHHFPDRFSQVERQQIVSAARQDSVQRVFDELKAVRLRDAWRWWVNGRQQTVRSVGRQGNGQIWVTFGIDETNATDGYAIWARYIMTNHNGHWVISQLF